MISSFKKFITYVIIIAIVGAGGFLAILFNNAKLQDWLLRRVTEIAVQMPDKVQSLGQNGLDLVFCGTASPMGGSEVAQQCMAVFAGDKFFIIDSGARSTGRVSDYRLPVERLDGVLLTHFHSDHISSLGELHLASWVRGRSGKLHVYGGAGVDKITSGFELAYSQDFKYRTDHHGEDYVPSRKAGFIPHILDVPETGEVVIYDADGLKISAFTVQHPPIEPAYGFRFDYKGRSIVISGDTIKSDNVVAAAKHADVLIHEVLHRGMVTILSESLTKAGQGSLGKIIIDTLTYHTDPIEAAQLANEANVNTLIFTHFAPVPRNMLMERIMMRGVENVRPQGAEMSYDGLHVHLPANGGAPILERW